MQASNLTLCMMSLEAPLLAVQSTMGKSGDARCPRRLLACESGDPYPQVAFRVQVARDELQEELLVAGRILAASILVLGHNLIEGAQAGVHILHSSSTMTL